MTVAEFDRFSDSYREDLAASLGRVGSIDLAIESKLGLLSSLFREHHLGSMQRILDFGCGTGLLSAHLGAFAEQVIGLDVSLDSLRASHASHSQRVAYHGSGIPIQDGTIDAAVASCVFHHIEPERRANALSELKRVLAPGGLMVIIEHNPWNPVTRWVVNRCEFDEDAVLLSGPETGRLMEEAGFQSVAWRYFFTVPPKGGLLRTADNLLGWLPSGAQFACVGTRAQ